MKLFTVVCFVIASAIPGMDAIGKDSEVESLFAAFPEEVDQYAGVTAAYTASHVRVLNALQRLDASDSDVLIEIDDSLVGKADCNAGYELQRVIQDRFTAWTVSKASKLESQSRRINATVRLITEVTGELNKKLPFGDQSERHFGVVHVELAFDSSDDSAPERISVSYAEHPWVSNPDWLHASKRGQRLLLGVTPTIATDPETSFELAISAALTVNESPTRRGDRDRVRVIDRFQQKLTRDYATVYRTFVLLERPNRMAVMPGPTGRLVRVYDRPLGRAVRSPGSVVFRISLFAALLMTIWGTTFILNRASRGYYERIILFCGVVACLGVFVVVFRLPL